MRIMLEPQAEAGRSTGHHRSLGGDEFGHNRIDSHGPLLGSLTLGECLEEALGLKPRAEQEGEAEPESQKGEHGLIIPVSRCNIPFMVEDLQALEDRLKAVATLVDRLRSENQSLRASLTLSEVNVVTLRHQIEDASQRIESLLKSGQPQGNQMAKP